MIKKSVTYTDYNDIERTEDHYFNLTKAEVMEMELGTTGGMAEMIQRIVAAQDTPAIVKIFKDLVLKAYGQKSPDGKYFMKEDENGRPLSNMFKQSEAYSIIYMELATDADKAAEFVNGIMPKDIQKALAEQNAVDTKKKAK